MMKTYDVIINGAGLVGASIGIALANLGCKVLIVEYAPLQKLYPKDDYGLRVSAFTPTSHAWLQYIGAWNKIEKSNRVTPYYKMNVWDEKGKGKISFDASKTRSDVLGWIVDNEAVQGVLLDLAKAHENITILEETSLQKFDEHSHYVIVTTNKGESYQGKLIIGADGGRSQIRSIAGIPSVGWSYGQKTIVGQVKPLYHHENACWQRFLEKGPVALLPINDGRCSLAWHTTHEEADRLLSLPKEAFAHELAKAFDYQFGSFEVNWDLGAYPLRLNHARQYQYHRYVLVGDAAHNIHPLAGLGVNIGFLDAATLVDELMKQLPLEQTDFALDALIQYEKRRKKHNLLIMGAMDFFKKSSTSDSWLIQKARNIGLAVADKTPFAKTHLANFAMGYYGDIPYFVKP